MLLVVGLGNPGSRYARNRHNAGFEIVAALADRIGAGGWRDKFHGEFTRGLMGDTEALLLRPMTFMNASGRSVRAAMTFFRVEVADLIVVHDELDLPFGTLRLKVGGGHAGHNGLRSTFQEIGSGDFVRLRVGIGRPPPGWSGDVADWVLSDMPPDERAAFPEIVQKAVKSLLDIGEKGLTAATNALNARPKPRPAKAPAAGGEPTPGEEDVAKRRD
ncbi:MAG: aminoacyl-tRNA hydrolase [Deltaproteobacteria bacterium]|nr:aminoacyl-tRNA hydrolase [Deltaproteobacteria bacterium]